MTSWKSLTAAGVVAATMLSAAGAYAAEGRQIALNYEVKIGGIHGVRIDTVLRIARDRFVAEAEIGKEGLLDKLSKTYRAMHVSRGRLLDGRIAPDESEASIVSGDEKRAVRASYTSDGTVEIAENPRPNIKPGREVGATQRRGAWDPLMAALMTVLGRQDPCAGTVPIYDGRTRFDLVPKRVGTESFASEDFKIKGPSVVCEVRLRKIAGYKPNTDPDEDFDKAARLWLGMLDDSGRLYPLRIEIDTNFGTVAGQLRKFTSRPLTREEELALAK
ncbi:MAG: hypothetical protein K0S54_2747 [Alphaproteobacteria bacterium]|jgi:hypothetical protein|nr:hypothetical protein [Alphaproteobacteria bacterium]